MSTLPAKIHDLAIPLYERGLLVHCLPYYGSWLWDNLTADSDLAAVPTTRQFGRLAQQVLAEAGAPAAGVGAHSLRRGGAAELAHGALSLPALSAALRHVSERSTRPHVFQSVHSAANAGAMRAAARRSLAGGLAAPGASAATRGAGGRARGLVAPQRGAAPSPRHLTNRGLCGRLVLDHDEPAFVGGVPALSPARRRPGRPELLYAPALWPARVMALQERGFLPEPIPFSYFLRSPGTAKILRSAAMVYHMLRSLPGLVQGPYASSGGGSRPH